ncbi:MAG: hypothetical protein IGS03_05505 [Candidatus Sericytochromatia bacterium]|nr:hypothetical protein [Candidatus Sericytochromatia bacterium]
MQIPPNGPRFPEAAPAVPAAPPSSPPPPVAGPTQTAAEPADTDAVQARASAPEGQEPNQMQFPEPLDRSDESKKKSYSDVWDFHADPGAARPNVTSRAQLEQALGNRNTETVQRLLDHLDENGLLNSRTMTDIATFSQRHGSQAVDQVAEQLLDFHQNGNPIDGVSKDQIVRNALHDIAFPSDIDQGNYGTCGAAALQMKMALEQPADYTRALTALSQNENYRTPGGATMRPNNTWQQDNNDNRNMSARIMQNAIMNLARQGMIWDGSYDSADDENDSGLTRSQQNAALRQLTGNSDYTNESSGLITSRQDLYQYLEDDLSRGRATIVSFDGHAVLVTGLDKSSEPPEVILNSWGRQYAMSVDEFITHVRAVRSVDDRGWDEQQTPAGRLTQVGDR